MTTSDLGAPAPMATGQSFVRLALANIGIAIAAFGLASAMAMMQALSRTNLAVSPGLGLGAFLQLEVSPHEEARVIEDLILHDGMDPESAGEAQKLGLSFTAGRILQPPRRIEDRAMLLQQLRKLPLDLRDDREHARGVGDRLVLDEASHEPERQEHRLLVVFQMGGQRALDHLGGIAHGSLVGQGAREVVAQLLMFRLDG